eukprot:COSAG01_NODE_30456_length_615_cov_2.474806_2_plen_88_part_01
MRSAARFPRATADLGDVLAGFIGLWAPWGTLHRAICVHFTEKSSILRQCWRGRGVGCTRRYLKGQGAAGPAIGKRRHRGLLRADTFWL